MSLMQQKIEVIFAFHFYSGIESTTPDQTIVQNDIQEFKSLHELQWGTYST